MIDGVPVPRRSSPRTLDGSQDGRFRCPGSAVGVLRQTSGPVRSQRGGQCRGYGARQFAATPDDPQVRGITCRDHVRSPLHWDHRCEVLEPSRVSLAGPNHSPSAQQPGAGCRHRPTLRGLVASHKRAWCNNTTRHVQRRDIDPLRIRPIASPSGVLSGKRPSAPIRN